MQLMFSFSGRPEELGVNMRPDGRELASIDAWLESQIASKVKRDLWGGSAQVIAESDTVQFRCAPRS